ncbi:hypothetical protein Patl1_05584 [Pistacia atlantica]|uniref:Uncharacterized protein n=1 Tax=Pistacia atlantica TaxID=434234 RepID=A0ACC1BTL6_9ROSI|nr:hypothetical protein Patl1_05584 [Pistacia atlantica]
MTLKLNPNLLMGTQTLLHSQIYPQLQTHYNYHYTLIVPSKLRSISANTYSTFASRRISTGRAPEIRATKVSDAAQFKQNWLDSLTSPPLQTQTQTLDDSKWVLGIDPDLSGALAVLKTDHTVLVGGRVRKRLDAKSIVLLLRRLDAPVGIHTLFSSPLSSSLVVFVFVFVWVGGWGTTAYIEQSIPYPKDGKQGWWSGGFGYGLWIGILVASGFSVVPVPSAMWKNEFELSGGTTMKRSNISNDELPLFKDYRLEASPDLYRSSRSPLRCLLEWPLRVLFRRAEALLIAAYGKGLKLDSSSLSEELVPSNEEVIFSNNVISCKE